MENGAYGVGASVNGMEGILTFTSYRDPSIEGTQNSFRESLKYIIDGNITEDELFKAVLNSIGKEIKPLSPGEKGHVNMRRLIYGLFRRSKTAKQGNNAENERKKILLKLQKGLYKNYDRVSRASMCGNEALESYRDYFFRI